MDRLRHHRELDYQGENIQFSRYLSRSQSRSLSHALCHSHALSLTLSVSRSESRYISRLRSLSHALRLDLQVEWMMSSGYAGWMLWDFDLDDFTGNYCGQGPYPLTNAMNAALG